MADKIAKLTINDQEIELPILSGSIGPDVVQVAALTKQGCFTYDPGFVSTASCESKITFIDGGKGVLLHRGYPIDELAEHSDHLETCFLLLNGELPTSEQKTEFVNEIMSHTQVDDLLAYTLKGFKQDAHPMAILCGLLSSLAAFYHTDIDNNSQEDRTLVAKQVIAKIPTITAMIYKHGIGEDFIQADSTRSYAENFLYMMFSKGEKDYKVSPVLTRAMDKIFLLHADHEQNASTSTVRLSGSTGTNPFAAVCAGATALWGPSHGGANEAVLTMLEEIGDVSRIDEFVAKAKDKADPFRLMGFGHRVYKNFDPRAKVMKEACDEVLAELGLSDHPLLKIAKRLEQIALEDPYFVQRKLYPNVDFYSGIILKSVGIPTSLFTVIFALGRTPGWIAHWDEMLSSPLKIGRPRQLYTGSVKRSYPK
ncbi:citrate synthase [Marinicellulosiphila megalodicopiae]|uniref:citrate synthase n=1 Tax=Marinicellulosiphila megalodicopiae TaxID=2724896 RepID=UPI003BB13B44